MLAEYTARMIPIYEYEVHKNRTLFFVTKRIFDLIFGLLLLLFASFFSILLIIINPLFNKGPLFFVQPRMGRGCVAFQAIKFRSMHTETQNVRSADCPLEVDRITPLGALLRKLRIDELPQAINVLRGEMSVIGPRPDYFVHAKHYLDIVPGYRERHSLRPGISGLAQTEIGYVEGSEATRHKVAADLHYIRNLGFRQEAWIIWRTFVTILRRAGS